MIAEALDHLQSHLSADRPGDLADLAAGSRLLGAGHALLRRWEQYGAAPSSASVNIRVPARYVAWLLERGRAEIYPEPSKQEIRDAA